MILERIFNRYKTLSNRLKMVSGALVLIIGNTPCKRIQLEEALLNTRNRILKSCSPSTIMNRYQKVCLLVIISTLQTGSWGRITEVQDTRSPWDTVISPASCWVKSNQRWPKSWQSQCRSGKSNIHIWQLETLVTEYVSSPQCCQIDCEWILCQTMGKWLLRSLIAKTNN